MAPMQRTVLLLGGLTVAAAFGPGLLLRKAYHPSVVRPASDMIGVSSITDEKPPSPAGEDATAVGAEETESPKARTLEDELPQLKLEYELAEDLTRTNTVSDEQLARVKDFQSRLEKTMEVKAQVEEMFVLEIKSVAEKLDQVKASEQASKDGVLALIDRFNDVVVQKKETRNKDLALLKQMKETQSMMRIASIKDVMDKAIDDKASLCDIEDVLVTKMEECVVQLKSEVKQYDARIAKVESVRATLPDPDDLDAVRAYTWADVEALKESLIQENADALVREQAIESIKAEFAAALKQRNSVLGPATQAAIASLEAPAAPTSTSTTTTSRPTAAGALAAGALSSRQDKPLADMSNNALAEEAILAGKDAGMAVVKLTASTLGVVGSVVATNEFAESAGAAGAAGSSLFGALGGLSSAFSNFNSAYKAEMENSMDDMFRGEAPKEWIVKRAWRSATQADDVKGALASASESSQMVLENAQKSSQAASQLVTQAGTILQGEEVARVSEAAAEAAESFRRGSVAFATLFQRALNVDVSKLLPPSS